jgi:hypothetical protein
MKDAAPAAAKKSFNPRPAAKIDEPANDFQARLAELKKKFK